MRIPLFLIGESLNQLIFTKNEAGFLLEVTKAQLFIESVFKFLIESREDHN